MILPPEFYQREDVVEVSRELLGKVLCTHIDGRLTQAMITETEAYAGMTDRASHAFGDRRTKRTEPMYGPGGHAYVYLCYGIHHLFNVVTNAEGVPHAVLIRAAQPIRGVDLMLKRRGSERVDDRLLGGPGSLARALGITTSLTGTGLSGPVIWIEDSGVVIEDDEISVGPRIGVDYAEQDAYLPYRFVARMHHDNERLRRSYMRRRRA
jgi:DNA-3-methyladenine glycosylase